MLSEQLISNKKWTRSEQLLIKFIQAFPKLTLSLSLEELSQKCYTSEASIIRFCKKLGFKGFSEFKIQLASELASFSQNNEQISVDIPLKPKDSRENVAKKLFNLSHQALEETYRQLNFDQLDKAAKLFAKADIIRIYARGESLIIAEDFHYKLLRIGKLSQLESLSGFQEASATNSNNNIQKAALVISHYCNSLQTNYSIDELISKKTPFVLLTANPNAWPYDRLATATLRISNTESRYKMGSFSSRTSMLFTLDCLYGLIFSLNYEKNLDNLTRFSKHKAERTYFYNHIKEKF
ncbi:MurR/RpiR family transcriptional regulator [Testudinibacter sp. P27/CKL/0425]